MVPDHASWLERGVTCAEGFAGPGVYEEGEPVVGVRALLDDPSLRSSVETAGASAAGVRVHPSGTVPAATCPELEWELALAGP